MSPEARWIAGVTASALHTAECMLSGQIPADAKLAAALTAEAEALAVELSAAGWNAAAFFAQAVPLTVRCDTPRQLAEAVLRKLLGPQHAQSPDVLVRRLTTLTAAMHAAISNVADELELRGGPLREQWEARGPGLLHTVRQLTEPQVIVDTADVLLVQPLVGGAGAAYAPYNTLKIEAMLANSVAALPEVVRLGWLWAQLNLDLPQYQDHVGRARLAVIGPLALIPPTLAAAQEVELARCDAETLSLALDTWRTESVPPTLLLEWWSTYQATNPSWAAALGALDHMLVEAE